jgi:hypothetical protein
MATLEKQVFELTNACVCQDYDLDTDTYSASDACYGCWEEEKQLLETCVIAPWMKANRIEWDTPIEIRGTRVNWDAITVRGITTPEDLIHSLSVNGDFTLRFALEGKSLTCVRSSHDEHGASFELALATLKR